MRFHYLFVGYLRRRERERRKKSPRESGEDEERQVEGEEGTLLSGEQRMTERPTEEGYFSSRRPIDLSTREKSKGFFLMLLTVQQRPEKSTQVAVLVSNFCEDSLLYR